jgi:hypothetical protein
MSGYAALWFCAALMWWLGFLYFRSEARSTMWTIPKKRAERWSYVWGTIAAICVVIGVWYW